jgi:hypothetical protein
MSPHKEENGTTHSLPDPPDAMMGDGVMSSTAKSKVIIPKPPTFENAHDEREYLKGRLAVAFRIFGKYGFDEGVAGHITVRVSNWTIGQLFTSG